MPEQPSLPFSGRSATARACSAKAARDAAHVAGRQAQAILQAIRSAGTHGLTRWDIESITGVSRSSACGRLGALLGAQLVVERPGLEHERTRPAGPWGRRCVVYVSREAAQAIREGRAA